MQGGVRKKGNRWYYYFDAGVVDGKRKKIERSGGKTKKEAQVALRKALNEFEGCGSIINETEMSFADYLDYWFKEYVMLNCKYNTQNYYRRIIDKHLKPTLGIYKLKNLTPAALQEFINKKSLEGYSKSSISNFMGALSGSLKQAVHPYQLIKNNPMEYVKIPKIQEKKKDKDDLKIISREDFDKIIDRFPFSSNFHIPLQIAFHSGMRGGEVLALTWDNINLEENYIEVKHTLVNEGRKRWILGTPKTSSSERKILIGKTLVNILKKHKKRQAENKLKCGLYYENSNFVCTKEDGSLVTTNSLKYLSRVVNYELCITFNFHSLRHTHATMLLEAGANIKEIQERLGHSKLATTMDTYSHVTQKMKQDTVNIFENIIN